MKLGDEVAWCSQAAGVWKWKSGTVVAVVPPLTSPSVMYDLLKEVGGEMMFDGGPGRAHESYIVKVIAGPRKLLYWPVVSQLQEVLATPKEDVLPDEKNLSDAPCGEQAVYFGKLGLFAPRKGKPFPFCEKCTRTADGRGLRQFVSHRLAKAGEMCECPS